MLKMKNTFLLIMVLLLSFIIFVMGGAVVGSISIIEGGAMLFLPFIFDVFFVRSISFLTASTPIKSEKIIRLIFVHMAGLIIFMLFQVILLFVNSGLLSIIKSNTEWNLHTDKLLPYIIAVGAIVYIISVLINYLIINIRDSYEKEKKIIKKELQIKKSELNVLKSVIQPHFLFNAFNTLTSLIETNKKNAGDFCIGLADYLRYSLRYSDKELVSVEEELGNLLNYLKIEKIRMGNKLNVKYDIDALAKKILVPSFSIITFFENGIKHGI